MSINYPQLRAKIEANGGGGPGGPGPNNIGSFNEWGGVEIKIVYRLSTGADRTVSVVLFLTGLSKKGGGQQSDL